MSAPQFRRGSIGQKAADAEQAVEKPKTTERVNQYPGKCTECMVWVEAGDGLLTKDDTGKWAAKHREGECPSTHADDVETVVDFVQTVVSGHVVFDGVYTLETLTGHRTFRLRTQARDDDFMPGRQIIAFLGGPDNTHDYVRFGHVANNQAKVWSRFQDNEALNADLKAFWADPNAALPSVQCYRCHRDLTVPSSVYNGLGPECAKKGL